MPPADRSLYYGAPTLPHTTVHAPHPKQGRARVQHYTIVSNVSSGANAHTSGRPRCAWLPCSRDLLPTIGRYLPFRFAGFNTESVKGVERVPVFRGPVRTRRRARQSLPTHPYELPWPAIVRCPPRKGCPPRTARRSTLPGSNPAARKREGRAYLPKRGYWRLPTFRADTSRTLRKPSASAWS